MSSRTAAARKRLQAPQSPKVSPTERSVNQSKFPASTVRPRVNSTPLAYNTNLTPITTAHDSSAYPRQLDLSNEFAETLPSPAYTRNFSSHQQSSDTKPKRITSVQTVPEVSAYPYEDNHQPRHSPAQLHLSHDLAYQNPTSSAIPGLHSEKRAPPAGVQLSYPEQPPESSSPPSYPSPSLNRYPGPSVATYMPSSSSPPSHQPGRHSPTPTDLPEYRSTYSSYPESYAGRPSFQSSTRSFDPESAYQYPYSSNSPVSPPVQPALLSPIITESRGTRTSLNSTSPSPVDTAHELSGDSASSSGLSEYSRTSTSTGGSRYPPPPPPSPNFVFPGSRSIARPKVSSKITNAQLKSKPKSKLRLGKGPQGNSHATLDPPSPYVRVPLETHPETPHQFVYPDILLDSESIAVPSEDYKRRSTPSTRTVASKESFVFPTSRSRAQPKLSSGPKSSKNPSYSSTSRDVNPLVGRSRFMEILFKKKKKVKTPNLTPARLNVIVSDSEVSPTEHAIPREGHIPSKSNYRFTVRQEQGKMKSRNGSYPLDPYNSVLLDNDRCTGELLSRLNSTGSPSFYDYGSTPPSSVLDLGCGQGHWVLEAAIAWKEYGTKVTGYDMVDISRNMLPWAAEQGVLDNIQFVRGNFLKQQLPFPTNTFDLVRMSCLALCIPSESWGFVLQEVCRVLSTGGRLELIDDLIFFPYGKTSTLINDASSIVESAAPRIDIVLSPTITTFSIYGDLVVNPGLGSTSELRDPNNDLGDETATLRHQKTTTVDSPTAPARSMVPTSLSPEAWNRGLAISEDLEALFEHMLLDKFDIQKDPSDFVLSMMKRVFGRAREVRTMHIVLAPPDLTSSSESPQGLSHCPGLILQPSTFIPMNRTQVEIHASKHLRTLLSCKNFLSQHAIEIAEDERVDEEFMLEALWEYENFLQHRFNPPAPSSDDSEETSDTDSIISSSAESTTSDSREAMWEIQSEFRQRFNWPPEWDPPNIDIQDNTSVRAPSPLDSPPPTPLARDNHPGPSSAMPASCEEMTHVRTFRVYQAIKLDNYILTYDSH